MLEHHQPVFSPPSLTNRGNGSAVILLTAKTPLSYETKRKTVSIHLFYYEGYTASLLHDGHFCQHRAGKKKPMARKYWIKKH